MSTVTAPAPPVVKKPKLNAGANPWVIMASVVGALALFPFVVDALMTDDASLMKASLQALAYIVMALGLNIVVGFAGLLDLGYVAFYAIGAFVVAWLGSSHFGDVDFHLLATSAAENLPGIHINFFIVLLIGAAFTAIWGALLGAPTLRLRGDYLAIVTLAFGEIVPRVFENSTSGLFGIGSTDFSNGKQGIQPIDGIGLPGETPINPFDNTPLYYIGLGLVAVTLFVNIRLRDSRLGRAWIAVREDEVAASSMGINLVRTKLWAYAIGAALGGFAGVYFGAINTSVNVDQFAFGKSVFILCMVIIGGMGNIWGVVLGAIALSMLNSFGLPELNKLSDPLGFQVTSISFGIFGFFMLAMMILRPEGFLPSGRRRLELHEEEFELEVPSADPGEQAYEVRQK